MHVIIPKPVCKQNQTYKAAYPSLTHSPIHSLVPSIHPGRADGGEGRKEKKEKGGKKKKKSYDVSAVPVACSTRYYAIQ